MNTGRIAFWLMVALVVNANIWMWVAILDSECGAS